MAPPGQPQNVMHQVRRANPLAIQIRRTLDKMASATPSEIRAYQERRLRALVRASATRSPFYRRWFSDADVDPASIRKLEDLSRLPLLDRRYLAERAADFRTYPGRLLWEAHSSGTSGTVITTYRTPGSSIYELAVLQRQWSWFGLPRNPRRAVLRGNRVANTIRSDVTKLVPGARQLQISSFHLTPSRLEEVVEAVRRYRPHVIEGWPSSITLLAALLRDACETMPVRAVITSSEAMTESQRALMREVFGGPVIDHYGQTERVCMAGNCEMGSYHVFSDYGVVELLPVAGDSKSAEVVGTPLHNWGFPLFRYRTGDQVRVSASASCRCGRPFPVLGPVDGRVEETFTAADGRPIPLPHCLIKNLIGMRETQVVQHAPGDFEIRMVPGTAFNRKSVEELARKNVEQLIGPGQRLSFQVVEQVPRTAAGKLKAAVLLNDRLAQE
jgi:phenylacetate-CoA ligase